MSPASITPLAAVPVMADLSENAQKTAAPDDPATTDAGAAVVDAVFADERQLTAQGAERKEQLLRSAESLFAKKGYTATRIVDICKAANVAKSLFYWYFSTKRDCYIELVRTRRRELRATQGEAIDRAADPLTQIRQGAEASVRYMTEHASYFAQLHTEKHEREICDVVTEGGTIYHADVLKIIRHGQATGVIVDADPSLLAVGIVTTVASFSNSIRARQTSASVDELATFVGDWVERALTPPR